LHFAVGCKLASDPIYLDLIKNLIEAGADVNAKNDHGETPLLRAALYDSPEVIKIFIKAGADVNVKNKYGYTPLMHAKERPDASDIIKILIEAGAKK